MRPQTLALCILASACANVAVDGTGPDTDPDGGPTTTPTPMNLVGKYGATSKFDLARNLPGAMDTLVILTQGEDAPAAGLWQLVINNLDDSALKSAAAVARELTVDRINQEIDYIAPAFMSVILEMGDAFGQMTRRFQTVSDVEVMELPNKSLVATHTVKGVKYELDGVTHELLFATMGAPNVVVTNIPVSISGTIVTLGLHKIAMPYGALTRASLDKVLIPNVMPNATGLGDVMVGLIDCNEMGYVLEYEIGYGTASIYNDVCVFAMHWAAEMVYESMNDADGMVFTMAGQAKTRDTNNDNKIDELVVGSWAGEINYGGNVVPLVDAKFAAKRVMPQ